jgi:DUF4097 and DUF4098 domain-containing protein YvlB
MKKRSIIFFFLVFAMTPLCVKSCYEYETEFRKTYSVKPGTEITISNRNGKIEIEKWDKDEVEVFAVIGSNKSMKELNKVKIEVSIKEKMEISTVYFRQNSRESGEDEDDFGIWDFIKWMVKGAFTGEKIAVDYEIKVPDHVIVSEVESSNGEIFLKGTKGPSELNTTNGTIEVKNAEEDVEARTTNGKVEIENVNGFVIATSTNGAIRVKSKKIKEIKTTNGRIEAELKEIHGGGVEIRTTNGSIILNLPASLNCILELSTTNGGIDLNDITLDVISQHKNKYIKGKMGKGGPKIDASTTNGGIKVGKL